jgi:hypothetical protein
VVSLEVSTKPSKKNLCKFYIFSRKQKRREHFYTYFCEVGKESIKTEQNKKKKRKIKN